MAYLHRDPVPEDYEHGGLEEVKPGPSGTRREQNSGVKNINQHAIPQEETRIVVAAIDFGTTYSGFAYGFKDELDRDPRRVILTTWNSEGGEGLISQKTPTSLLLDPDGKFKAFGYEAEYDYMQLANDNAHIGWKFFRRFKMKLHNSEGLKRETILKDDQGKDMRALDVFAHAIRYLKKTLLADIQKKGANIRDREIQWVLTIPAIWDPRSKQFMREAAELGGIPSGQLEFALEPEAASVYLKDILVHIQQADGDNQSALTAFNPGTKYMVLDLGGGTVDITAREVKDDRTLWELYHATGNDHGGNTINEQFMAYIESLVGKNVLDELRSNPYKSDYLDLEMEIELKKRGLERKLDTKKFLTIKIPASIVEIFEELNGVPLRNYSQITSKRGQIELKGDKLRIHIDIIESFFLTTLKQIHSDTQKVLRNPECKGIDRILLVGGFAKSESIATALKREFSGSQKVKVVIPQDPDLAVLKGAVLYRHWPEVVSRRRCPHTYGSRLMRYFLEGDDKSKRKMIEGVPMCVDVFKKFVTIGDSFQTNETLQAIEVNPVRRNDTNMKVKIYKTDVRDAKYVTEEGCTELGDISVDMPDTTGGLDRTVHLTMTLGHTEIIVKGKHIPNGDEAKVTFDMLS